MGYCITKASIVWSPHQNTSGLNRIKDNFLPVWHKSGDSSGLPWPATTPLCGRGGAGGGGGAGGDGVAGGGVGGVPQLLLLIGAFIKPGQKYTYRQVNTE